MTDNDQNNANDDVHEEDKAQGPDSDTDQQQDSPVVDEVVENEPDESEDNLNDKSECADESSNAASNDRTGEEAVADDDTTNDNNGTEQPAAEDLTPDEFDVDKPDDFDFEYIDRDLLPREIQYTPEFDDQWIYPSGSKSGGGRDDVPVQGLELGVVGRVDDLEPTVKALLDGLATYYENTDQYPRHRFITNREKFDQVSDEGTGLVAVFQPRPDQYDGLIDHMSAIETESNDAVLNPNWGTTKMLAAHLLEALYDHNIEVPDVDTKPKNWAESRWIGNSSILERYGPLAAGGMYDPVNGETDIDQPDGESVADLSFTPAYLNVSDTGSMSDLIDITHGTERSAHDEVTEPVEEGSQRDGNEDADLNSERDGEESNDTEDSKTVED